MLNKMHQGSHLGLGLPLLGSGRQEVKSEKVSQERKEWVVPHPLPRSPPLPERPGP